jgi:predicted O-methyltransferase YrrM
MDARTERVLEDFHERIRREHEVMRDMPSREFAARRDEFLLPVGRAAGSLLNILAREARALSVLEVGTSYGYSTVWLADALRDTGGQLVTIESDAEKVRHARDAISRCGLAEQVAFEVGDALEVIPRLEETFDFVLIDLWKDLYVPCFEGLHPKLRPGAIVIADNMLYPQQAQPYARSYQRLVRSKPDMESVTLPVGSGIEVSRCTRKS